jgi:hypothetical protein
MTQGNIQFASRARISSPPDVPDLSPLITELSMCIGRMWQFTCQLLMPDLQIYQDWSASPVE